MYSVFQSSYTNTHESLGELGCGNTCLRLVFPEHFSFSQTSTRVFYFVDNSTMIMLNFSRKFTFTTIVFCSTLRIAPYLFYIEKFTTQFKTTEKK